MEWKISASTENCMATTETEIKTHSRPHHLGWITTL